MAKLSARKKAEIEIPKRLLSVTETAVYLGMSARSVYNGTSRKSKKKFPVKPLRIGGLIKFDIKDLDHYIESLKEV